MILDEVLTYYKNAYQFQKQTKMSINNIRNWRIMGHIPIVSQMKIEKLTKGDLKANMEHVKND